MGGGLDIQKLENTRRVAFRAVEEASTHNSDEAAEPAAAPAEGKGHQYLKIKVLPEQLWTLTNPYQTLWVHCTTQYIY